MRTFWNARVRLIWALLALGVSFGATIYAVYLASNANTKASNTNRALIVQGTERQQDAAAKLKLALDTLCRSNRARDALLVALAQDRGVRVRTDKIDCVKFSVDGKPKPLPPPSRIPVITQIKGLPGTAGAQGKVGAQGLQGVRGPLGPIGPVGPAGAAGPKGDEGPPGIAGPKGDQGPSGAKGDPGPKGDKGDPGAPGAPADAALINTLIAQQQQDQARIAALEAQMAVLTSTPVPAVP